MIQSIYALRHELYLNMPPYKGALTTFRRAVLRKSAFTKRRDIIRKCKTHQARLCSGGCLLYQFQIGCPRPVLESTLV